MFLSSVIHIKHFIFDVFHLDIDPGKSLSFAPDDLLCVECAPNNNLNDFPFRSLEGSDLLITFVPASFDDLRLLINGPDCLRKTSTSMDQLPDAHTESASEVV